VLTHIDFPATSRYLSESARVLAPSGRLRASFFLDDTTGPIGRSGWNFVMRENDLRRAIEQAGLEVLQWQPPAQPPSRHAWFLAGKH
jgi:hypothetical protein